MSYIQIFNPSWIDFWFWFKIGVQFHSSTCGYPAFPLPFIKETLIFLLPILGSPVKYLMTIDLRVYSGALNSIPLTYVPVFMPIPYCFDYITFIIYFKIKACDDYSSVLFFSRLNLLFGIWFHTDLGIFSISVKNFITPDLCHQWKIIRLLFF